MKAVQIKCYSRLAMNVVDSWYFWLEQDDEALQLAAYGPTNGKVILRP